MNGAEETPVTPAPEIPHTPLAITLQQQSVTNTKSGEVFETKGYVQRLQDREEALTWIDEQIEGHMGEVKGLKEQRVAIWTEIRSLIRDSKPEALPLFEQLTDDATEGVKPPTDGEATQ